MRRAELHKHPRMYTYAIHHYNPCYNVYLYRALLSHLVNWIFVNFAHDVVCWWITNGLQGNTNNTRKLLKNWCHVNALISNVLCHHNIRNINRWRCSLSWNALVDGSAESMNKIKITLLRGGLCTLILLQLHSILENCWFPDLVTGHPGHQYIGILQGRCVIRKIMTWVYACIWLQNRVITLIKWFNAGM